MLVRSRFEPATSRTAIRCSTNCANRSTEGLAKEAEEAAQKGEQRDIYEINKLICGKYSDNRNVPIRDQQEQLLTSEKDQEARWVEHFKEVFNRPAPEDKPDIPEAEEDLSVATRPPKKEDIIVAINSLRNRKTPGKDRLNAELFKADRGTEGKSLMTGIRVSSSRYQRKELCLNVATGEASHYYPPLVRS